MTLRELRDAVKFKKQKEEDFRLKKKRIKKEKQNEENSL